MSGLVPMPAGIAVDYWSAVIILISCVADGLLDGAMKIM
jgi:hypothetical protein